MYIYACNDFAFACLSQLFLTQMLAHVDVLPTVASTFDLVVCKNKQQPKDLLALLIMPLICAKGLLWIHYHSHFESFRCLVGSDPCD